MTKKLPWSSDEELLLKTLYPSSSKNTLLSEIHRTWRTICERAHILGIKRCTDAVSSAVSEGKKKWSKEEDDLLISLYSSKPKKVIQLLFRGKKWDSIRYRAWELRLKRDRCLYKKTLNDTVSTDQALSVSPSEMTTPVVCHQYLKKIDHIDEDIKKLSFDPFILKASDFVLSNEKFSKEITNFIVRYEWLGTIGFSPKWCFTARYMGILAGVVLVNEPTTYSGILGKDTMKYEALIQRGATISWSPKNLGSRLVMFSCRWMVDNTDKRAVVAYSDANAGDRGIIYQACNFECLGDDFGVSYMYKHPDFKKTFSSRTLRRTSNFIKWCKENNVTIEKGWIKENGFKDPKSIPKSVYLSWASDIKATLSRSEKIPVEKKRKYVIVLGKDRREQHFLDLLKTYRALPYSCVDGSVNKHSTVRRCRSADPEKIKKLIDNYGKMTTAQLAHTINETSRWVKRRIRILIREGKIISSRKRAEIQTTPTT